MITRYLNKVLLHLLHETNYRKKEIKVFTGFQEIAYLIDTIQDFLCNLGMKPHMYLVEIPKHFFTKS